MTTISV